MAKIGNLTGRSMADVASAIGQPLTGNDARNMHNNRTYKDQVGAPNDLRQWEEYDPNPYVPPTTGTLYLYNQGSRLFTQFEATVYINGIIEHYTGSGIEPGNKWGMRSHPLGTVCKLENVNAIVDGTRRNADYIDSVTYNMVAGGVYLICEFY